MLPAIQKRLSYANVAATIALVFSMTGGALAAKHYLVNSTKQINPKVLKKLKGAQGKRGPTGPAGAGGVAGAKGGTGATGAKGEPGPFPTGNLPRGITIRGNYAVLIPEGKSGKNGFAPINFGFQFATEPAAHFLTEGASSTPECPGTSEEPKATPGNLCVYETKGSGSFTIEFIDPSTNRAETDQWGSALLIKPAFTGEIESLGTWAATSP